MHASNEAKTTSLCPSLNFVFRAFAPSCFPFSLPLSLSLSFSFAFILLGEGEVVFSPLYLPKRRRSLTSREEKPSKTSVLLLTYFVFSTLHEYLELFFCFSLWFHADDVLNHGASALEREKKKTERRRREREKKEFWCYYRSSYYCCYCSHRVCCYLDLG